MNFHNVQPAVSMPNMDAFSVNILIVQLLLEVMSVIYVQQYIKMGTKKVLVT